MKAIILISSLFYILGLKIGNKIDLVKKEIPVQTTRVFVKKPLKCCQFNNHIVKKSDCDSVSDGKSYSITIIKNIKF